MRRIIGMGFWLRLLLGERLLLVVETTRYGVMTMSDFFFAYSVICFSHYDRNGIL